MAGFTTPASQSNRIWVPSLQQYITIGNLGSSANPQQMSMPQHAHDQQAMNMTQFSQNSFAAQNSFQHQTRQQSVLPSPSVAATNCYAAGFVTNQQYSYNMPGRPQPVYAPGVAATNRFPAGPVPGQQQMYPQPPTFGGQSCQDAFAAPTQSQYMAQNAANTFTPHYQQRGQQQYGNGFMNAVRNTPYIDLTGPDDHEEVQQTAPATPDVPVPSATTPFPVTQLATPPPSRTATPETPSHLTSRLKHLEHSIRANYFPCAFRLLVSFKQLSKTQQRKYCALFWPSNEEALADLHQMAELSPEFSAIYWHRTSWQAEEAAIQEIADADERAEKQAAFTAKGLAKVAEMKRICKATLQDLLDQEELSQFQQTIGNIKGQKSKLAVEAQKEAYEEECKKVQQKKKERWARVNPEKGSDEPAGKKRKRGNGEVAPVPKKRGRTAKAKKGEEGVRVLEVAQVQEPTPDNAGEADDDGLEAAMFAGLMEDSVEEDAGVEPPCQIQEREEESAGAVVVVEDLPAAISEVTPADENVVEGAALPDEEDVGGVSDTRDDDVDSLFGDDGVVEDTNDDVDSLFGDDGVDADTNGDDVDSLFGDDSVDADTNGDDVDSLFGDDSVEEEEEEAANVDTAPQEVEDAEMAADDDDILGAFLADDTADDEAVKTDSLDAFLADGSEDNWAINNANFDPLEIDWEGGDKMFELIDSMFGC
jgi:hypothetical protein